MKEWLTENLYWIFDGVGVFLLGFLVTFIFKNKKRTNDKIRISQSSGKKSINIQNNNFGGGKND